MLSFHLDENVDFAVADGLNRRGISCTRTPPQVHKGASDEFQLAYCLQTSRMIVSNDRDMLAMASAGVEHAGIAYYYQGTRTIGQLISRLAALCHEYDPQDMKGRIEFL